jgi:deoxyribose-phosphate aldolase
VSRLPPWLATHATAPLAALIDHTLLKPEAGEREVRRLVEEGLQHRFGAVCVNGQWVAEAADRLRGSAVRVAAVVGFPLGANGAAAKVAETRLAVASGAREIDMVIALGWALAGSWDSVGHEIGEVVSAAEGRLVKVILETAVLDDIGVVRGAVTAIQSGAGMVKTSTGFHPAGGATVRAVQLLRQAVGDRAGVKAAGGIRTAEDAIRMLLAGADRIGTSSAATWGRISDCRLDEYLARHDAG